ncbi:T9SS type A sorting domain-containing protein [Chryseobacterium wangxinyae]|uniref:T9SS type A sorting domain-containing protein n=1 Tax=Chryseobacterium sp. CY353 TaxID=2997334 RepID=UPI0022701D66|nr:T9SS type A sorting domain-containing protein [Chryseobacterium sp. CY353]MCY0970919.1 T9SS type A sorting domain-containing protein [Chryseobacterium sp. CY353]
MKKNLFIIGLLSLTVSINAQTILLHLDATAKMYVSKGTLVYNGGGLQTKGSGANLPNIENHGNFMIVGNTSSDVFRNLDDSGAENVAGISGTFVNKLNESANFALRNTAVQGDQTVPLPTLNYTYGQVYISGIPQSRLTGVVNQEFASVNHGAYQQIGIPFWDKSFTSLSQFGKTFNTTRYSQNEALVWSNANTVFDNSTTGNIGSSAKPAYSYYILGGGGNGSAWASNGLAITRTLIGRPVSDQENFQVTLSGAGSTVSYGTGGNAVNAYNEKYNTYLGDYFAYTDLQGNIWDGVNFGKNLYFFSNPYLTNLDLNNLINPADPNYISNLRGIRFEPTAGGTTYVAGQGGSAISFKSVSRSGSVWTGDTEYLNVRPFGTFVIKLANNTTVPAPVLNFANLRRFNYHSRAAATTYSVTASKNGQNTNTGESVKQLAVLGLDANGNELARTYYVVSPNSITGASSNATTQVGNNNTYDLGTYEENPTTGGYDPNFQNAYWLYINEANDNFVGKNIKMVRYTSNISSFKFFIKENGEPISNGTHPLSTGIGFYFKGPNGVLQPVSQGQVISATGNAEQDYDLYYGQPAPVLGSSETKTPSRTIVIYNPAVEDYIVRFDPKWKNADIQVFDMSGKLIISQKAINTSTDYTIKLQKSLKAVYVVKVISDKGEIVQTKIER